MYRNTTSRITAKQHDITTKIVVEIPEVTVVVVGLTVVVFIVEVPVDELYEKSFVNGVGEVLVSVMLSEVVVSAAVVGFAVVTISTITLLTGQSFSFVLSTQQQSIIVLVCGNDTTFLFEQPFKQSPVGFLQK